MTQRTVSKGLENTLSNPFTYSFVQTHLSFSSHLYSNQNNDLCKPLCGAGSTI